MTDPLIHKFGEACGATAPLSFRVDLPERGVLAEGTVAQPFSLIGRDDACDVTLADPDVNLRHVWLQVVSGRLFAVDLGSRTGLGWGDGSTGSGWMDIDSPLRVGPFRIHLRAPVGTIREAKFPVSPLHPDAQSLRNRPPVVLEFRNGRRAKDRWTVNRLMTLVGRSPECKIHLHTDDIAAFHCGLVYTESGLWVVDLSGQGVVVNGERMRVAPLKHGAELWVGRFLIGCHYPEMGMTPATGHPAVSAAEPSGKHHGSTIGQRSKTLTRSARPTAAKPADEDEVALGESPVLDPASGLPSSHILADAFDPITPGGSMGFSNGPLSGPGSGSSSAIGPKSARLMAAALPLPAETMAANPVLAQVLAQMGDVHAQMLDQFQQSVMMMVQMFGQMHREQMGAMQKELAHIQQLNCELTKLQVEVARVTLSQGGGSPAPTRSTNTRPHRPASPTPLPGMTPALGKTSSKASMAAAAMHDWVAERISALQKERKTRWDKLVGLLAVAPEVQPRG